MDCTKFIKYFLILRRFTSIGVSNNKSPNSILNICKCVNLFKKKLFKTIELIVCSILYCTHLYMHPYTNTFFLNLYKYVNLSFFGVFLKMYCIQYTTLFFFVLNVDTLTKYELTSLSMNLVT